MKNPVQLLITCLFVFITHSAFAQQQEGCITYEVKIDLHRKLGPDQQQMKGMLPEFRKSKQLLAFNTTESLYKPLEDEESDMEMNNGGGMRMRISTPYAEKYFNTTASRKIALLEYHGKDYLVTDSVKVLPWKFGSETKNILGHSCKQAYYINDKNQKVTAWYSEKLRPFLGPEDYNSLPGGVLEVDINEGEHTITALKLEPKKPGKNDLKEPAKGQKMTRVEYQNMMQEKMEKMRSQGGNVIRMN